MERRVEDVEQAKRRIEQEKQREKDELEQREKEADEYLAGIPNLSIGHQCRVTDPHLHVHLIDEEPVVKYRTKTEDRNHTNFADNVTHFMIHAQGKKIDELSKQVSELAKQFNRLLDMVEFAPGGEQCEEARQRFETTICGLDASQS